jgi:hypothetical protein
MEAAYELVPGLRVVAGGASLDQIVGGQVFAARFEAYLSADWRETVYKSVHFFSPKGNLSICSIYREALL